MTTTYSTKDIDALTKEIDALLVSLENMTEDLKGIVRVDLEHLSQAQHCINVAGHFNMRMVRLIPDWGNLEVCRNFRSEFYRVGNLLEDFRGNYHRDDND